VLAGDQFHVTVDPDHMLAETAGDPAWRCCTSLTTLDSHHESMRLHGLHEQTTSRPLSHDELVQLQRVAQEAGVSVELGRQGHERARAA